MVGEELVGISAYIIEQLGKIGIWLKTIGVLVIIWLGFQIYSAIHNIKRMREIGIIKKNMDRIEGKIDQILKKKN